MNPFEVTQTGQHWGTGEEYTTPMMSQIIDNLWLGGCINGLILPDFIQHVISLYPYESYYVHHNISSKLEYVMRDDVEGDQFQVAERLSDWAVECVKDAPTLIHCQFGYNRSGLVAGLTLKKLGYYNPVDLLREKRCEAVLCNPSFEDYVLKVL